MKKLLLFGLALLTFATSISFGAVEAKTTGRTLLAQAQPQVVTLTQTACQFVEPEAKDYNFTSQSSNDCQQINRRTLDSRKQTFKATQLKAGDYIFRVSNRDVPYELGFYLRGAGLKGATLPRLSGGGFKQGQIKDYRVTLKRGTYVFNCPLNPTPDYTLVVS